MSAVVRTPAEFVATVPHLIGYHPGAGDLVAVFLGLDGRKVVMSSCSRVTTPSEAGDSAQASRVAAPEHQTVLLVGYDLDPDCLAAARNRLQQAGSHVRDALRVSDGQVWTWEGGAPAPVAAGEGCQAVAALVGAGSAPVDSRAAAYARVLPRERAALLDLTAAAPVSLAATWMLWQTIVDRGVQGLTDEAVATAVASLQDDDVAGALLLAIGGPRLGSLISTGTPADVHPAASPSIVLDRFCGLCRALPDNGMVAPTLAMAAAYAWFQVGDGAITNAILVRAGTAGIVSPMLDVLDVVVALGLR